MARPTSTFPIMVATAVFLSPPVIDAQTREIAFSVDEGTWLSLDV